VQAAFSILAKRSVAGVRQTKAWALGYLGEVSLDGSFQIDDGMKAAAPHALARHGRKESLDCVERRDHDFVAGVEGGQELEVGVKWRIQGGWRASHFVHPWTPASAN
jgi:hypothetical protein